MPFHLICELLFYCEQWMSRHFMQIRNFSKIRSKIFEKLFFENIASFSY